VRNLIWILAGLYCLAKFGWQSLSRHLLGGISPNESSFPPKCPNPIYILHAFFLHIMTLCFISNIIYIWYDQTPRQIQLPQTQKYGAQLRIGLYVGCCGRVYCWDFPCVTLWMLKTLLACSTYSVIKKVSTISQLSVTYELPYQGVSVPGYDMILGVHLLLPMTQAAHRHQAGRWWIKPTWC